MPEIIQLLSKSYTVRFIGINVRTETVDHKRSQLIHQKSKTRFQDQNREITTVQQPSLHDYTCKHESTYLPSHGTKRNTKQPRTERPKSCNTYLNHIWSDSSGMISETETLDHRLPQFIHSYKIDSKPDSQDQHGSLHTSPTHGTYHQAQNRHPNWSHQTIPSNAVRTWQSKGKCSRRNLQERRSIDRPVLAVDENETTERNGEREMRECVVLGSVVEMVAAPSKSQVAPLALFFCQARWRWWGGGPKERIPCGRWCRRARRPTRPRCKAP
jgi:hypothetical protein